MSGSPTVSHSLSPGRFLLTEPIIINGQLLTAVREGTAENYY